MLEVECCNHQHMTHRVQYGKTFSKLQKDKQRTKMLKIGFEGGEGEEGAQSPWVDVQLHGNDEQASWERTWGTGRT